MRLCFLLVALASSVFAQAASAQVTAERSAARFLDQATWGPTPSSIKQLEGTTIADWLNAQFALNTSDLPDQPILNSDGKSNDSLAPVKAAFFQNAVSGPNAVTGEDQLRQRVAFVLSQIWVVSQTSGVSPAYAYPPYWRIFRDNAFGNYRDCDQGGHAQPRHGPISEHGKQQQGQSFQRHRRQRK